MTSPYISYTINKNKLQTFLAISLNARYDFQMSDKKFKQLNPDFNLSKYKKELTESLVVEMIKIIDAEEKLYGSEFGMDVKASLLASFISTLVYRSLTPREADTAISDTRKYEVTLKSFEETKEIIRRTIEEGFSYGFQAFNPGTVPDYQCEITLLDPGVPGSSNN